MVYKKAEMCPHAPWGPISQVHCACCTLTDGATAISTWKQGNASYSYVILPLKYNHQNYHSISTVYTLINLVIIDFHDGIPNILMMPLVKLMSKYFIISLDHQFIFNLELTWYAKDISWQLNRRCMPWPMFIWASELVYSVWLFQRMGVAHAQFLLVKMVLKWFWNNIYCVGSPQCLQMFMKH